MVKGKIAKKEPIFVTLTMATLSIYLNFAVILPNVYMVWQVIQEVAMTPQVNFATTEASLQVFPDFIHG